MIEVPIYIPARHGKGRTDEQNRTLLGRDQRMGEHFAATIAAGSAIVGTGRDQDPGVLPGSIIVYYEGNLYGAANMVTFADRAMHAYWRMRDRYPTAAMMAVPVSQLQLVAHLLPEHGRVEVISGATLYRLARWLDLEEDATRREPQQFPRELVVSGVTIPKEGEYR